MQNRKRDTGVQNKFWTLWEKARVGCFERTACILSIVKQITSEGGWRGDRDGEYMYIQG